MYAQDKLTIFDRREFLKIKLKSLAAEAKFIRHEEKKTGTIKWVLVPQQQVSYQSCDEYGHATSEPGKVKPAYWRRVRLALNPLADEMLKHRTRELREEARLTGIAYGLIRGKSLEKTEGNCKRPLTETQRERICAMIEKYGSQAQRQDASDRLKNIAKAKQERKKGPHTLAAIETLERKFREEIKALSG